MQLQNYNNISSKQHFEDKTNAASYLEKYFTNTPIAQ